MTDASDARISGQLRDVRSHISSELEACEALLARMGGSTRAGAALSRSDPSAGAAAVLSAQCREAAADAAAVAGRLSAAAGVLGVVSVLAGEPSEREAGDWPTLIANASVEAAVTTITKTGAIAAVVADGCAPACLTFARALGWDGQAPVFRLSRRKTAKYATELRQRGEGERAAWFAVRAPSQRVLLIGPAAVHCLERLASGWLIAPSTART